MSGRSPLPRGPQVRRQGNKASGFGVSQPMDPRTPRRPKLLNKARATFYKQKKEGLRGLSKCSCCLHGQLLGAQCLYPGRRELITQLSISAGSQGFFYATRSSCKDSVTCIAFLAVSSFCDLGRSAEVSTSPSICAPCCCECCCGEACGEGCCGFAAALQ